MGNMNVRVVVAVLLCAVLILPACSTTSIGVSKPGSSGGEAKPGIGKGGPPAHAPAHGYRKKHPQGPDLVFDSGLGVYVAVGIADLYFHNDSFFRLSSGQWEISVGYEGPWSVSTIAKVPPGLQKKGKGIGPGKGKGQGNQGGQGKGQGKGNKGGGPGKK